MTLRFGQENVTWIKISPTGEPYVHNTQALQAIVDAVREGYYCTVLGPRYCQKNLLLDDAKAVLEESGDVLCLLLDLQLFDQVADHEFLGAFAALVDQQVRNQQPVVAPPAPQTVSHERSLQHFLQDYLEALQRDLVLLINHLEHIRIGPLTALLLALRAIYIERSAHDPFRLGVITASSLRLAELSLGPNSPFNIARLVWISNLDAGETAQLSQQILQQHGITITPTGQAQLMVATGGDRYLIPRLCAYCARLAAAKADGHITQQDVALAIEHFNQEEIHQYSPLRETVRVLESDPTNLLNVVRLLDEGPTLRRSLNLALDAAVDALQLTGAVRVENHADEKLYHIRNEIYAQYLRKHFHPERIVRVLSLSGEWKQALHYLERLASNDQRYRTTLIATFIDSVDGAPSKEDACEHLSRLLSRAFDAPRSRVYLVTPTRAALRLVAQSGFSQALAELIPLNDLEQPEVQSYTSRLYQVARQRIGESIVLFPLQRDENHPLGVVAVHGFDADPQGDEFLEMQAFLKQASRAIGVVIDRQQTVTQFEALQRTGKRVTSSLDLKQVITETVQAAIEAVPAAQRGLLFLWDDHAQQLTLRAQEGYRANIGELLHFASGEDYTGWVFAHRQPLCLGNALIDGRTKPFNDAELNRPKSVISVPLEAWGRVLGVLSLENTATLNAFQASDLGLLYTFGAQAAIAIQNASLYTELYQLGMAINQGELDSAAIFRETVQSITRVSDAKAANMLLLRDTEEPLASIAQKPLLSVSAGLSNEYDEQIKPRIEGLTAQVLATRQPHAVSRPDEQPGINELTRAHGIQACLCLPLMIYDTIIGILFVHYDKPHTFADNEIHMLSLFANQAALAIENARQREELQLTEAIVWSGITISTLAHRITQKITAIGNTLYGVRRRLNDGQPVTEQLDRIGECVEVIKENLLKARMRFSHSDKVIDLHSALKELIPQWLPREDEIALDTAGLRAEQTLVCVDPSWLNSVLEILIINAVRALRTVDPRQISLTSFVRNGQIIVEISNNGAEIPPDLRDRLFRQRITKVASEEGSGIGLLHARAILRRYKGDVELVDSKPIKTTFALKLPIHRGG